MDPRAADHLSDCTACAARYGEFVAFMEELRAHAEVNADAQFPAERLVAQRQQILRRLEQVNGSARVIAFPGREVADAPRSSSRLTGRWLAAAAAAGLFIGMAVGGYVGPDRLHRRPRAQQGQVTAAVSVQPPSPASAVLVSSPQVAEPDDDAFLMELEMALVRPHSRELQPFDAMTPPVRDIDDVVR